MGQKSSIDTIIPITLIHVRIKQDSVLSQEIESNLNSMIYVFGGRIVIENQLEVRDHPLPRGLGVNQQVKDGELAILSKGEKIKIRSDIDSEFLILAGPEINEPVARYGPFVMNSGGDKPSNNGLPKRKLPEPLRRSKTSRQGITSEGISLFQVSLLSLFPPNHNYSEYRCGYHYH